MDIYGTYNGISLTKPYLDELQRLQVTTSPGVMSNPQAGKPQVGKVETWGDWKLHLSYPGKNSSASFYGDDYYISVFVPIFVPIFLGDIQSE